MAKPYPPSLILPRDLAVPLEILPSGCKAWEFMLYLFGLDPALLHPILPRVCG